MPRPRPKHFVIDQLWRKLQKMPGATARELAHAMRWSLGHTSSTLRNLRYRGAARTGGYHARHTRWWAVGDRPPECHMGEHPNSLANLRRMTPAVRLQYLGDAFEAKGIPRTVIGNGKLRWQPSKGECALAECWKMPVSRTPGVGGWCIKVVGKVRPEQT